MIQEPAEPEKITVKIALSKEYTTIFDLKSLLFQVVDKKTLLSSGQWLWTWVGYEPVGAHQMAKEGKTYTQILEFIIQVPRLAV